MERQPIIVVIEANLKGDRRDESQPLAVRDKPELRVLIGQVSSSSDCYCACVPKRHLFTGNTSSTCTAALDSHRGRQVMELFRKVAHERGSAVIVVTHDHRSLDVFDRTYEMEDGQWR
jgi:hypothetical protein